ncbi:probable aspartate-1-decarboxylase [Desulfotalea psychrophila LSv54]|nr:probable aspartate-1-decarboxylase [Desulfotalea psychrophila LSv54]
MCAPCLGCVLHYFIRNRIVRVTSPRLRVKFYWFIIMLHQMMKAKLHRATISAADLNYEGSLTIDTDLLKASGIRPYERIYVYNVNNGERFETYAIEGEAGSGAIQLNGAAARKGMIGDFLIIVTYALCSDDEVDEHRPNVVLLNPDNTIKEIVK